MNATEENRQRDLDTGPAMAPGIYEAVVTAHLDGGRFGVRITERGRGETRNARCAMVPRFEPARGDRVLVAVSANDAAYVIGLVHPDGREAQAAPRVRARDGASASLRKDAARELLEVSDASGQLLFSYDPEGGTATVSVAKGDLKLASLEGSIELCAREEIRVTSVGATRITSASDLDLNAAGVVGASASRFAIDAKSTAVRTSDMHVRAESSAATLGKSSVSGETLHTQFARVRSVVGRIESLITDLIERSGTVSRTVEGLNQLRCGRYRLRAGDAIDARAKRVSLRSRGTTRIDGEHIHLG